MKYFIVQAHHEAKSFNAALTRAAQTALPEHGHEVQVSDLYAMNFNPVSDRRNFTTVADGDYLKQQVEERHAAKHDGFAPDIQAELDKLDWCDVLVFQFPIWWFGLPAILKGWVDRVFAMGRIYGGGRWFDDGYFAGRRAMISLTTGGGRGAFSKDGISGDIHAILEPVNHGILRFNGFDVVPPFIAWAAAHVDDERREGYLRDYVERLLTIGETEPIPYPSLDDFDPKTLRLKKTD
ncbi:MAG: NAD(P)H-dependent oxidoreductase [Alphaproteobacteria bacterium]|jgi:NAD(P)H dehydrogenase (quinone)|nr:NAD(P)H-dependent oxidoreductase [Alphaproteobacteria bacterium]MDP6814989.1 NAD(P)H-dependent oxidoreductase [Alphaproteobacteria bacterium]